MHNGIYRSDSTSHLQSPNFMSFPVQMWFQGDDSQPLLLRRLFSTEEINAGAPLAPRDPSDLRFQTKYLHFRRSLDLKSARTIPAVSRSRSFLSVKMSS